MGLMGAMNSAATLAHATYLATGVGPASSVTLDGQAITMINGYPTANAAGIAAALQGTDYSYQGVLGVGKSATCYVGYVASVGGLFPSIGATSSVTGC
jgi:MSHA pilin protein MshA